MAYVLLFSLSSWLFLRALIPALRRRLLDLPNARSSHLQPTPRGGGLVFVLLASVASGLSLFTSHATAVVLPLLAFPLALIGLLDDQYNLPAIWRYGAQLITAILILCFSPLVNSLFLHLSSLTLLLFLTLSLLVIAVTALINFTNFVDGLDGLVAGSMSVALAALAISLLAPWPLWALIGALVGFLPWNWSPAKVFMGDVGSTFLGAVYAGLVLQASSWLDACCYLMLATPLFGDACLCVVRRWFSGHRVFEPHRLHLFQRLHQAGWSHSRVSIAYISATGVLSAAMLAGGFSWLVSLTLVVLLVGVFLDQRVAIPFNIAAKS